ncbi:hypothetical protein Glove_212g180 [Diversispora epigaea]|uniref:Uncharacterized protein n=1 Tax=Diversispora epigaea TaxID=1348612 RepID=A0A397IHY4_9GLOM|nr:hypothetical protein Glove_212g180 [Diversispora epigaea]
MYQLSTSAVIAFCHDFAIENWTFVNMAEYYLANPEADFVATQLRACFPRHALTVYHRDVDNEQLISNEFSTQPKKVSINKNDVDTRSLFFEEEWKEITTSEVENRPELEKSLKELLKKYTVDDVERLREILFEPFIPNGCKNENPFDPLKPEGWYEMNVWSHFIDPAFYDLNIDLIRVSLETCKLLKVDLPKRYVTRVQRRKVCEVAGHLTKSKPLALVLKEIFYVKYTILQTSNIINHKYDVNVENFLDD